ncbi:MAG: thrombospondin type 3 repeat-containing protein, partial [Bacteroidia bacterium]|nr:thrombospondin type 3 repeat-containing protein [Bacteroidia bacterium]
LSKSPFKETLKLTKEERKAAGIPPNKYFEEEYELTMNPFLGRPTFENLNEIREKIKIMAASKVPGDGIDGNWVSRGPDNFGGRTRAVMFDPNDLTNETVFAGGVSGGLWKNTQISDANTAWTRVDIPSNLNMSSIAYDPNNTNVFYVGTGESYVNGDVNGDGVWKSEDAGETWSNVLGGISGPTTFQSASNITVNSPAGLAGDYISVPTGSFGSTITSVITADLVLANDATGVPTEGCNAFGEDATGKIALIRRGACNFTVKVKNAQDAGAIGVIMMNNIDGTPIPMGGTDETITIPAVMISKSDGDLIEAAVNSETVNASLNPTSGTFTGNLVPGIQHINDVKIKDNAGVSEIYVAAGEAFYKSANAATYLGGPELGLYKSIDGGATWTELNMPLTVAGNKHEPNDIEVGADGTIWISTTTSTIYGDGGGKIFSSSDGVTFTDTYTVAGGDRTQIAVSSQNAGTIYILAEISDGVSMQVTTDGFATTPQNMALPNDADPGIPATDFTRGQAFYDLLLDVDPANDQILYAGGIDLFKSVNAGAEWTQFSHWFGGYGYQFGGPDQHATAFANNAPNRVVFGNDQGVFFSDDSGTTLVERTKGYITTQFYTLGVGPTAAFSGGDYIVGGLQDNGTLLFEGALPGINSAIRAYGGDGAYSFFDQDGTDQYFIRNYVYNNAINLFDLASNTNVTINDENSGIGSFINPQGLDSNLDILYSNYSSGSNIAIRRYSGIKSQNTIQKTTLTDPEFVSRATAFTVSPYTTTSSTVLVGTVLGDILKVENADTTPTWTNIETENIIVGSISDLEFGANENEIFATIHNYGVQSIWYTNDGGATWTGKEGDLPDLPVKAILQSPLNPEEVIIGTELGVWYTDDFSSASPSWFPAFNGMSNVKVTDLDLRDDNAVFASTYGRGVFSGLFTLDPNGDVDSDGVLNATDNCVNTPNADQADADGNGIGDACQDTDNDSVLDINDNCVDAANTDQADADGNGIGDACQDTDGDTIVDIDDNCIDTPNPDQEDVNANGIGDICDTSYENPENISLEVISESCEGQDNGQINISINETFVNYTATLIGSGVDLTQPITTGAYSFEDLAVGSYTICVSVDGRDFEQCFEINIEAADSLDGIFGLADNGEDDSAEVTSISIDSGTPPFSVFFNNEVIYITNENTFEVETIGSGLLEVKSAKACEGVMSRFMEGPDIFGFTASPNPVIDNLKITFSNIDDGLIPVQVYDINGKLLINRDFAVQNTNYIQVPFNGFESGVYFISLNLNKPEVLKIIKK